jgi:hypothetical protein
MTPVASGLMVKSSILRRKKQRHEVNNKSENKKNVRNHIRYPISADPVRPQEKRQERKNSR